MLLLKIVGGGASLDVLARVLADAVVHASALRGAVPPERIVAMSKGDLVKRALGALDGEPARPGLPE